MRAEAQKTPATPEVCIVGCHGGFGVERRFFTFSTIFRHMLSCRSWGFARALGISSKVKHEASMVIFFPTATFPTPTWERLVRQLGCGGIRSTCVPFRRGVLGSDDLCV